MRTVKLNVFKEHREWMNKHSHADRLVFNAQGEVIQAIYFSPLEQWRGLIARDGTVDVPDTDYYNALHDPVEMAEVAEELRRMGEDG